VPPTDCALPTAVDQRSFLIRVGLGDIPASTEEVRHEIGDWLDDNQPMLQRGQAGELVLSLTVAAADLWLSLLLAMASVTQTGYQPHWIEARPTAASRRRRRAR
jgi:hypothetical protein